jgi:hypothetical protein
MVYAVVIFIIGSSIQAGAVNIAMLFLGKLDEILYTVLALSYARTNCCWNCGWHVNDGYSPLYFRGMDTPFECSAGILTPITGVDVQYSWGSCGSTAT